MEVKFLVGGDNFILQLQSSGDDPAIQKKTLFVFKFLACRCRIRLRRSASCGSLRLSANPRHTTIGATAMHLIDCTFKLPWGVVCINSKELTGEDRYYVTEGSEAPMSPPIMFGTQTQAALWCTVRNSEVRSINRGIISFEPSLIGGNYPWGILEFFE